MIDHLKKLLLILIFFVNYAKCSNNIFGISSETLHTSMVPIPVRLLDDAKNKKWECHGRLIIEYPTLKTNQDLNIKNRVCHASSFLINPYTLLTAAHNLFIRNRTSAPDGMQHFDQRHREHWSPNPCRIHFLLHENEYILENEVLKSAIGHSEYFIPTPWLNIDLDEDLAASYDFAIIFLKEPIFVVHTFYTFNAYDQPIPENTCIHVTGYPGKLFSKEVPRYKLATMTGQWIDHAIQDNVDTKTYHVVMKHPSSDAHLLYTIYTEIGNSGCPVHFEFNGQHFVIGIHNKMEIDQNWHHTGWNSARRITPEVAKYIQEKICIYDKNLIWRSLNITHDQTIDVCTAILNSKPIVMCILADHEFHVVRSYLMALDRYVKSSNENIHSYYDTQQKDVRNCVKLWAGSGQGCQIIQEYLKNISDYQVLFQNEENIYENIRNRDSIYTYRENEAKDISQFLCQSKSVQSILSSTQFILITIGCAMNSKNIIHTNADVHYIRCNVFDTGDILTQEIEAIGDLLISNMN